MKKGIYKNLLTFNEPDLPGAIQYDGGASQSLWPKLEEIGFRLGSPLAQRLKNYCGGWLADFLAQCQEKRATEWIFIAVHCYQTCALGIGQLAENAKTQIYRKYGSPIWPTPGIQPSTQAPGSGNPNPNLFGRGRSEIHSECTAMLESLEFGRTVLWFVRIGGGANPTEGRYSRLFRNGELAATGKAYRDVEFRAAAAADG